MPLNSRTFIDFDVDFLPNPITKDILKKTNESSIAQSIGNLLQTSHYERLFNANIGCNLKRHLFEPIDNISTNNIKEEIVQTITNYEPRVKLLDVSVVPDYDSNGYTVSIKFFVNNDPQPITITFFLERVR
jgi:phage baseplate assembly protein W